MSTYVVLSIIVLVAIVAASFLVKGKGGQKLSPMAGIAFAFVLAGILFGESRMLGYSLMGIGVILAIADIVNKQK